MRGYVIRVNDKETERDRVAGKLLSGAALTEKQMLCLSLSLYDGYSYADIGEQIGITKQAVERIINRAKHRLQKAGITLPVVERKPQPKEILLSSEDFDFIPTDKIKRVF